MMIAVTGTGVISPLGLDPAAAFRAACAGEDVFRPVATRAAPVTAAALPEVLELPSLPPGFSAGAADRCAILAVAAAADALRAAGLTGEAPVRPERIGVVLGSGAPGLATVEQSYERLFLEGAARPHPLTVPRAMASGPASWISMVFGLRGPACVVSSACASAAHAMMTAVDLLRCGRADAVVTGGAEACLAPGVLSAWRAMRVLSADRCRPFSRDRDGLTLGEGAGILVLERLEDALARGARPLALLAGGALTSDAGDLVAPAQAGMEAAMRLALADAGLPPEAIDHVNAHGTGTGLNDQTEARALAAVFPGIAAIPVTATKSLHGHALGASPAIEAVLVVETLRTGLIPPTARYDVPDPALPLDVVAGAARRHPVTTVLSNSFAFGGLDASLIFRAVDA